MVILTFRYKNAGGKYALKWVSWIGCELLLNKAVILQIYFYLFTCVCVSIYHVVVVGACPQRSEEGMQFYGARVKVVVSCPMQMLRIKLKSSAREASPLNH